MNPANLVTFLRLLVGLVSVWVLYFGEIRLAAWLFLVFWILDAVDGYVARKFKCETKFGKNFDLIVDGGIIFLVGFVFYWNGAFPKVFLYWLLPAIAVYALQVLWGIVIAKNTFIPSAWRKLNGGAFYVMAIVFLFKLPFWIAWIMLVYTYVARVKYFIELKRIGE